MTYHNAALDRWVALVEEKDTQLDMKNALLDAIWELANNYSLIESRVIIELFSEAGENPND